MISRILYWRFFLIVALLGAASCSLLSGGGDVQIRVANRSSQAFAQVRVEFPGETEQYGSLGPGAVSEYAAVEQAYRYAYVEVRIGDRLVELQPIDYVGESLLSPGRYTYDLRLDATGSFLLLDLIEDR